MIKYYQQFFIYFFITCIVILMALLTDDRLFYILLFLWFLRLFCLKHTMTVVMCCFVSILMTMIGLQHMHKTSLFSGSETTFRLRIPANTIVVNGDKVSWRGYVDGEELQGEYIVQSHVEKEKWETTVDDMTVVVTGTLEKPMSATNMFQFDYARYLKQQRNSFWIVKVATYNIVSRDMNIFMNWRRHIKKQVPMLLNGYIDSLLFGKGHDDVQEVFQNLGVIYLVSLSGIHIQWLLKGLEKLLWRSGMTREVVSVIIRIVAVCIGTMGVNVGVLRSIIDKLLPRTWTRITKLSIIGMCLLCINPYYIFHLGFQLSFGLSILSCMVKERVNVWLMSTPFLSATFFEIPMLSLMISPIIFRVIKWLIFPIVWITAISVLIPINTKAMFMFFERIVHTFHHSVSILSAMRIGLFVTGRLPDWRYVLISICMVLFMLFIKRRRYFIIVLPFVFLLYMPISQDRIVMIDVGQGSSMLLQKNNHTVLVDTGGDIIFKQKALWKERDRKPLAKRTLVPVLKSLGISQLSSVILTHADQDHVGALEDLKKEITIKEIVYAQGAPIDGDRAILAPRTLKYGDLQLDVMWPIKKGTGENDDSVVIYTTFGNLNWLLMGDAGIKVEEALFLKHARLKTDVLVVGHHGSRTSSSKKFIEHISPRYSLISVGKNNRFNHPDSAVLDNLKDTKIYRTDEHGGITFEKIDGKWQFNTAKD